MRKIMTQPRISLGKSSCGLKNDILRKNADVALGQTYRNMQAGITCLTFESEGLRGINVCFHGEHVDTVHRNNLVGWQAGFLRAVNQGYDNG